MDDLRRRRLRRRGQGGDDEQQQRDEQETWAGHRILTGWGARRKVRKLNGTNCYSPRGATLTDARVSAAEAAAKRPCERRSTNSAAGREHLPCSK
jgi:hypothetical protein